MQDKKSTVINFYLSTRSVKEARKKFPVEGGFYVVDIHKIIKDLGYDMEDLTLESEFVINYSIEKKITQGIYSTRSNDILIVHRGMSESFSDNLGLILEEFDNEYEFKIIWIDDVL